jgi:hypothetical protein
MGFSMRDWNLLEPCLWLAVDVSFDAGVVNGPDAPELWRAVIKDGLLATRPDKASALLEPMRAKQDQGQKSNVDCSGLVIESRDQERGARLFLKFLGQAYRFAPACLLALQHGLTRGIGRQSVKGSVLGFQAWQGERWHDIDMPLRETDLERWRADPAVLAGFGGDAFAGSTGVVANCAYEKRVLHVITRTRWLWRQQGKVVSRAPDLADVLALVNQRVERFDGVWGRNDRLLWAASFALAQTQAGAVQRLGHDWSGVRRKVGGKYPSHGHMGSLVFEGGWDTDLLYWLYAGSFLHVGQQTAIGLGGYGLKFDAQGVEPLLVSQKSNPTPS